VTVDALETGDLISYAERVELNVERFVSDYDARIGAERIAGDVAGADLSGVTGTPTFFFNGRRHYTAVRHRFALRGRPRRGGGRPGDRRHVTAVASPDVSLNANRPRG
jgi:hypothetical protein